jgi:hypothetical protein
MLKLPHEEREGTVRDQNPEQRVSRDPFEHKYDGLTEKDSSCDLHANRALGGNPFDVALKMLLKKHEVTGSFYTARKVNALSRSSSNSPSQKNVHFARANFGIKALDTRGLSLYIHFQFHNAFCALL